MQGSQTLYRAELQGAWLFAGLADDGDTLTLDNKSVVDYGPFARTVQHLTWTTAYHWQARYAGWASKAAMDSESPGGVSSH